MPRRDRFIPEFRPLELRMLPGTYGICRLPAGGNITWAGGDFVVVTRCSDELLPVTVICEESRVPDDVECDRGWRVIRFVGAFGFCEVGVLAGVINILAEARVPVLTIGTFETDYVLVKAERFDRVRQVLEEAGHRFIAQEPERSPGG